MLIRFRVRNFLSFKDEVEFSMIPGRSKQHLEHLISGGSGRNDLDLLPIGVIYGANASGKSNFVHALSFAKKLITQGVKAREIIPVTPFRLDTSFHTQSSKFEFELRCGDQDYLYGFEVNAEVVQSEWLHQIKKTTTTALFERNTNAQKETTISFDKIKFETKDDKNFFDYVARGTSPNQLFLSETIEREVKLFEEIYTWFENLTVIYPDTPSIIGLSLDDIRTNDMVEYLKKFGTGICGFDLQEVSAEAEIPKDVLKDIKKELKPGSPMALIEIAERQRYVITKSKEGKIVANKFFLKHRMNNCDDEITFDTRDESDGTNRLMDLLPILVPLNNESKVYIIDELDRSLHPNLGYEFVKEFLAQTGQSQLIVTTHESNLLTFDLLRRDEIWFVEKDQSGATSAYSLEEYTPRYDKDIQKGYLLGRFGAIPVIGKTPFYAE